MLEAKNDIIPVWQPVGYSTNEISRQIALKLGIKTSHTGTLDPMAEGVIIVLSGEQRFKKYDYAHWLKTYEFEICFGLSTDSFDGMGYITDKHFEEIDPRKLENVLLNLKGAYSQQVPVFSAIKYKGKKLFEYARENIELKNLPLKSGTIYDIELISFENKKLQEVITTELDNLKKITGEFRQEPIIKQWEDLSEDISESKTVQTALIGTTITKGLYVRSLSQDICAKLAVPSFITKLIRTKNGDYTKNSCFNLQEVL